MARKSDTRTHEQLLKEIDELRARLNEADETLRAIREGEVDAVIVTGSKGDLVFSLSETENLHRLMVETMAEAGFAVSQDGAVLFCNERASTLLDRSGDQLLGKYLREFVAEQDVERLDRLLAAARTRTVDDRVLFLSKNGPAVPMHLWASRLVRADGLMICLVGTDLSQLEAERDLTEQLREQQVRLREEMAVRRAAEEELHRNREWLRVTLTSIGDAVVVTDPEGRITFLNTVAATLTGWNAGEAVGQPLDRVCHIINEQTRQPSGEIVARVLAEKRAVGLGNHTALVTRDGREIPIEDSAAPLLDARGEIVGVVLVFHDVTEKRRAQERLLKAERHLRLAIEGAGVGIWSSEQDAETFEMSERARELAGFGSAPSIGRSEALARVHPEDRARWTAALEQALRVDELSTLEYRVVLPDGEVRWLAAMARPFDEGGIRRLRGIVFDITVRKQLELDLRAARDSAERAKADAEAANRAKDHFLAVLSHELRTPLAPVLTGVSLLEKEVTGTGHAREYLEIVRRNVELESRLIDDLLDLTRIAQGRVELDKREVELCTIITRAIEVCQPDIDARRLHIGVDWGPRPYLVNVDAARLQQVFWNLIKNAIKFTPKGGCVGVRCRREAGHVVIEVNDSGIGIEAASLLTIFDAFAQAESPISRHFGGLGLGLAISRSLVEMHGGSIEARSEGRGKGATFSIRLPLITAAQRTGTAARLRDGVEPAGQPGRRILLVEDHGDTARMTASMLEMEGHTVQTAGDVAAALQYVEQEPFDLVISDLGLPDRSGLDLMRELRARGVTTPGIALSGYGQQVDVERSRAAGFQAHLIKPVQPTHLLEVIQKLAAKAAKA